MLSEEEWEVLIDRIKRKQCTPFLGAGAGYGVLPLGGEIAREWAAKFGYPFEDTSNLIRVSQFVAVRRDPVVPKELILKKFRETASPDFTDRSEPHRGLAELRLPVYLTTNYDSFMAQALRYCERDVERELYRWNRYLKEFMNSPSIFERDVTYLPTPARPLVFHLHGNDVLPDSLVLTEDDYINFLVNTSQGEYPLPLVIQRALTGTSLLFIGYSIADWNFRVLLNSLNRYKSPGERRLNVAVMPLPESVNPSEVQDYLARYYSDMEVRVCWATARQFLKELRERMDQT